jgi:hypoxanthine phosphoribosyltransferase
MKKPPKRSAKKPLRIKAVKKTSLRNTLAAFPGDRLRVVYSDKQIQKRVGEVAAQVNHDFQGRTLHVIGILENCFLFMSDLVRRLKVPVICHFLKADINDSAPGQVAVREIVYTPRIEVAGNDVLLVDGILQSGVTLDHLSRLMWTQKPRSLRTAILVEKVDERKVDVETNYVGFKTQEKFLVGYGLGYQERYRNLPHLASRT